MIDHPEWVPRERNLVAEVIYNRLAANEALGIDATIRYATGNFDKPLTESELSIDSPYSTRLVAGLPPTPINGQGSAQSRPPTPGGVTTDGSSSSRVPAASTSSLTPRRSSTRRRIATSGRSSARANRRRGVLDGDRRRLAVLGHDRALALAAIHNAAFEALGIADEWSYGAIDVAPERFPERVGALAARASWARTSPSRTSTQRWRWRTPRPTRR